MVQRIGKKKKSEEVFSPSFDHFNYPFFHDF